ncbi:hypothetical protein GCE86_19270 [Micromonospora terminaliae]|uniref:Tyrosine-type recombinase/integrase n=1 Tax=Micromonospora terminaliae TaxID=1914461 RepID=A0AAJ3DJM1_9ACTN|nr:hypothetical protein [Micromonospora terminaliae]NES29027.1 hypothetical protein [Micromonospora terminaliae]QGL48964.1 hypothetical protein GCE86_19270 [Micromonospora terminaliae]
MWPRHKSAAWTRPRLAMPTAADVVVPHPQAGAGTAEPIHTGNTLAAASGASTRELMHRMGHATMRAALIYQHATSERDREIASAMDRRIGGEGRRRR